MPVDQKQIAWELSAIDRASSVFKDVERGMAGLATAWGQVESVIAGGAVAGFILKIVEHTKEAEQASARLDAILRNTGAAAGYNREQLDAMAGALAKSTQFDDDALRKAEAELLVFGNIHGETFKTALKLSADLAAFWGTDLPSAARDVGKALAEPETAFKLLKSAGVVLTDQQKDQIKHMGALGDTAGQQAVIMEKLQGALGGVSEEMNSGFTKATSDASKAWDDLIKALGKTPLVHGTVEGTLHNVTQSLKDMKKIVEDGDWTTQLRDTLAFLSKSPGAFFPLQLVSPFLNAPAPAGGSRSASGKIGGLPAEPSTYGGVSNDQYAAERIKRLQAFGISEINVGAQRDALTARQKVLDDAHNDGLVSEENYYAERRKLIEEKLVAELTAVQEGRAAQKAVLDNATTPQEVAAAQLALKKLDAQENKAILGANTEETLVASQKRRAELAKGAEAAKALGESYTQVQDRVGAADQALADFNEMQSLDAQAMKLQTDLLGKSAHDQGLLTQLREIDLRTQQAMARIPADQLEKQQQLYAAGERAKQQAMELYEINYAAAKSWETGVARGMDAYFEEISNHAAQMERLVTDSFHGMEDALVQFVKTGKVDIRSLGNAIVDELIRIQVQQSIMQPLLNATGGSGIFGGIANLLGFGGGVGGATSSGASGGGSFSWGGAQAGGGDYMVTRPTLFLAGEAGPERATFSGANRANYGGGRDGGGVVINQNLSFGSDVNRATLIQWADGVKQQTLAAVIDLRRRNPSAFGA